MKFFHHQNQTKMTSELILHSDVLDIIFEKRNKQYGAYTLRKFYNNRLIKALGVTLGLFAFISAFTLIPKEHVLYYTSGDIPMPKLPVPKKEFPKKDPPKQVFKATPSTQKKFVTPVVVDNKLVPDTIQAIKEKDIIGAANIITPGKNNGGIIGNPGTENGNGDAVQAGPAIPVFDANVPTDRPEVEPTYPGGINALRNFLQKNLRNPTAMEESELVAVNVRFVVGFDGKLQNFTVVKDGGDIYNNEVIRVLKKMPQWVPGKSNGQNVAVYFTIPIKFVPAD